MSVGTMPGEGGVNNYQSFPALKTKKVRTTNLDFSAGVEGVLFYDLDFDAYITNIRILFTVAADANAAALNVGTAADPDALVDDFSISQTAAAKEVQAVTLTTAFNDTAGQATGFYKVPKGTPLVYDVDSNSNAAQGVIEADYILIDPGI